MEASSRKRLSLDTNVLFDLADRKDFACDFREAYQRKGYALVIPPTVVAELYFLRTHGGAEEKRLASLSLSKIGTWDIQVFPLTGVQLDVARHFALALSGHGLVPSSEINDAFILAETAVAEIPVIVSSDKHLLDIDRDALRTVCLGKDLVPVFPANPRRLLRAIR